jgi:hypothetical protein
LFEPPIVAVSVETDDGELGCGSRWSIGSTPWLPIGVAVGPSDRVYWNFGEARPTSSSPIYPYLISLEPGV